MERKNIKKYTILSPFLGAIWAPKIVKIEPGASKRPPEEQQAHKKRPRGTKSIKKMQKNHKKTSKKAPRPNIFAVFFAAKKKSNKKYKKNIGRVGIWRSEGSTPRELRSEGVGVLYLLGCYVRLGAGRRSIDLC